MDPITFDVNDVTFALNPWTVLATVALGYLVWLAITREPSPFARARRPARANVLRLGRICGAVFALSWIVTVPPPQASLVTDLMGAVFVATLVLAVGFLVALGRAFLAARTRPGKVSRMNAAVAARARELESDRVAKSVRAARGETARVNGHAGAAGTGPGATNGSALDAGPVRASDPASAPVPSRIDVTVDDGPSVPRLPGESAGAYSDRLATLERLDEAVRTHDIGGSGRAPKGSRPSRVRPGVSARAGATDVPPAQALAPLPADAPPSVLRRRLEELGEEIRTMRRVAIAQRAALDFERESHARTRASAARAFETARAATADRRKAVKLARRERRARLELEGRLASRDGARQQNAVAMGEEDGTAA